jgi:hypothetical protein
MARESRSWWRRLVAAGVLVGSLVSIAVLPSAAVADQRPIDVSVAAYCDTETMTWDVGYVVHNQTPVTLVFERAEDPTTGLPVEVPPWGLTSYAVTFLDGHSKPADATTAGLHVWIRRIDRDTAVRYGGVFDLPGTCEPSTVPGCATAETVRLRHTFDGPAGAATIEVVGPPLCPDEDFVVNIASYGERNTPRDPDWLFPFDYDGVLLSARYPKASLQVELPACQAEVRLEFWDPFEIAGMPSSRSDGPPGQYFGPGTPCESAPSVISFNGCDAATIRLANAPGANTPVAFALVDVANHLQFPTLALEPGESTVVRYAIAQLDVYTNGTLFKSVMWRQPHGCGARQTGDVPAYRRPPPDPRFEPQPAADGTVTEGAPRLPGPRKPMPSVLPVAPEPSPTTP